MTSTVTNNDNVVYTARVRAVNGRGGYVKSETGELALDLARPATRGTGEGTDPEELFAAGYAACFDSALTMIARRERVLLGDSSTTVSVSLHVSAESTYSISVKIHVDAPGCEPEEIDRLALLASTMCPYSNAVRGNVAVELTTAGR